jgi:hypothetical protein
MPEEYTLENILQPNEEKNKIKQIPERYVAALNFSGCWTSQILHPNPNNC